MTLTSCITTLPAPVESGGARLHWEGEKWCRVPLQTGHAAEPELPDLISIRLYSSPRFLFRQRLFNLVHRASESFTVSGWLWLMVSLLGISLGYCSHCSACTLSARSSRGLRCTPIVAIRSTKTALSAFVPEWLGEPSYQSASLVR